LTSHPIAQYKHIQAFCNKRKPFSPALRLPLRAAESAGLARRQASWRIERAAYAMLKKSEVTAGFSGLGQDKLLTLPDRAIPLRDPALNKNAAEFEVELCEGILARDPCHENALRLLGHLYTARKEYKKGLEIDRRTVRLRPDDPLALYNLACSLSLLEQLDEAAEVLQRAVTLGFGPLSQVEKDPDLANLRKSPLYQKILTRTGKRPRKPRS
jgi:tetratricopeptide (TPR) repeat protein